MKREKLFIKTIVLSSLIVLGAAAIAYSAEWQPVTGADNLRKFMSGRTLIQEKLSKEISRGEYRADGTGTLYAWGTKFPRNWEVKGEDQICVSGKPTSQCYTLERSSSDPALYRATDVEKGIAAEIRITDQESGAVVKSDSQTKPSQGGPAKASADEMAKKLANPANPIMKIGNNFDYTTYDGDLPGAGDQNAFRYVFLTVFPFKLNNGNSIFFRPGIPVLFNQPVPDGKGDWTKEGTDLGDTAYDLLYSGATKSGTLWGYGLAGTIPTATNDKLGADLWGLGPEVFFGTAQKWGVVGGVLSHQWDIGGSGTGKINKTNLNYFYSFPLGNALSFAAGPSISYNHDASSGNEWTVPLGIGLSKTVMLGSRPWTFHLQYWYNVERPDAFAAEHTIRFTITPIVSAPWNEGK